MISCNTPSNSEKEVLITEQLMVASETTVKGPRLSLVADQPIKNIIFMIGDGTGIAQLYSGQLQEVGPDGYLHAQRLPITGIVKTHADDDLITDSASGATAYSCGIKTNNGVIAQDSEGNECVTLMELAQQAGMKTGLVATSGVTHATPASFATHIDSRNKYAEIAEQMVESEVDVILGGGLEYFIPSAPPSSSRCTNSGTCSLTSSAINPISLTPVSFQSNVTGRNLYKLAMESKLDTFSLYLNADVSVMLVAKKAPVTAKEPVISADPLKGKPAPLPPPPAFKANEAVSEKDDEITPTIFSPLPVKDPV